MIEDSEEKNLGGTAMEEDKRGGNRRRALEMVRVRETKIDLRASRVHAAGNHHI